MAVITVLGAGMMGSAFCVPLVDRGHEVRLVGTHLDDEIVESLKARSFHPKLKLELPRAIKAFHSTELEEAARGADVLGLGVSSAGIAWATEKVAPLVRPSMPLVMITKGLELVNGALMVLPDIVRRGLPEGVRDTVFPAAIAGPCIAGELARRVPTSVVVTGRDEATLRTLKELLATDYYHVFPCKDVVGAEICAALKNAYAMGVALGVGLHEKNGGSAGSIAMHNWESAVFAQSIREMMRVISLVGGDPWTATGLPGVGDLDVTMNGGRTGRFGRWLGLGLGVQASIARMEGATLECLEILAVMESALASYGAASALAPHELPLLRQLIAIALHDAKVEMPFDSFFQA